MAARRKRTIEGSGSAVPRPPNRRLDCPICGEQMGVQSKENVWIDVCSEHGIWLDLHELEQILGRRLRRRRRARKQTSGQRTEGRMEGAMLGIWSLFLD